MGLKKILVAGATGNVGYAAKHFSHLAEQDGVGVSRREPQGLARSSSR